MRYLLRRVNFVLISAVHCAVFAVMNAFNSFDVFDYDGAVRCLALRCVAAPDPM